MKTYYLVYKSSYDGDFDNHNYIYILGIYNNEDKAKEICNKDFCKNTYYKELKINQEVSIEL